MTTTSTAARRGQGSVCPVCERFIGPAEACPYCDSESTQAAFLRVMRWGALALSLLGVALLYLAATRRELPAVAIRDINPMMNFASVRVRGRVARAPYVARKHDQVDYVSFPVDDGTGELRVAAYRATARALVDRRALPDPGAAVDVTGSLNVPAGGAVSLRLQSADSLKIESVTPP